MVVDMKKLFAFVITVSMVLASGCDREDNPAPDPEPPLPPETPEVVTAEFTAATMEYDWEVFNVTFSTGSGGQTLRFGCSTEYFEDAFDAVLAEGTYTFSENGGEFTFGPGSRYSENLSTSITAGEVTIEHIEGVHYSVAFDVALSDGRAMKGAYEGDIVNPLIHSFMDSDTELNFNEMYLPVAGATRLDHHRPGTWRVMLAANASNPEEEVIPWMVALYLNTAEGLAEPPTGRFEMAEDGLLGIEGTAEPSVRTQEWSGGCHVIDGASNPSWGRPIGGASVPGEGFVDISREGDQWTVEFSFDTYNGETVSGSYTGWMDIETYD